MLSICLVNGMNITRTCYLLFWLGSCQLGLKVFHWERKFCLLISSVFSILEVYIYLNSVLLVFCFWFLFCFVLFPRGQAWVSGFRNQYLVRFLSQNYIWLPRTLPQSYSENISRCGWPLAPLPWKQLCRGTAPGQLPCLTVSHQTSSR